MKKLLLSILIVIMLFNLVGPQVLFSVKENTAKNTIENKIDNRQYKDEELTEVQIPLNMPYYSDMAENVAYGETTIEGKFYRYVKRKVQNNVLHLYCLPNITKDQIENDKIELAKNDSKKETNKNNYKTFGLDFFYESEPSYDELLFTEKRNKFLNYNENIDDSFVGSLCQPPELS